MIGYVIVVWPTAAPRDPRRGGSLDSKVMASDSPQAAHSPKAKDDAEVLSQRTVPDGGEAQEAPEGKTPVAGHQGESIPMETGGEGRIQFGPQPDSIPETDVAPESGTQPPSKDGGMPILPVTPVQPGASDNLLEVLRGASIVDEHHVLMGTVIERVQSAKSGLTKACSSLLTGFVVSDAKKRKSQYRQRINLLLQETN